MRRIVKVSLFEFTSKWPSRTYINKYHDYGIKCSILSSDLGILWDKYVLRLEGSVENMELYLNYLKCEGFKIK